MPKKNKFYPCLNQMTMTNKNMISLKIKKSKRSSARKDLQKRKEKRKKS